MLHDVFTCDLLSIVPGSKYHSRFPFERESFWIRSPSSTPLAQWQTREQLFPFIKIRVTQHIRSRVYRGELDFGGVVFKGIPGECAKTVVIKNADAQEDINKLAYESMVNLILRNAGVTDIPKIIGLFLYTSMEEGDVRQPNAILVMEDVGQPLADQVVLARNHMYASIMHIWIYSIY
jgi:hypothetical protein